MFPYDQPRSFPAADGERQPVSSARLSRRDSASRPAVDRLSDSLLDLSTQMSASRLQPVLGTVQSINGISLSLQRCSCSSGARARTTFFITQAPDKSQQPHQSRRGTVRCEGRGGGEKKSGIGLMSPFCCVASPFAAMASGLLPALVSRHDHKHQWTITCVDVAPPMSRTRSSRCPCLSAEAFCFLASSLPRNVAERGHFKTMGARIRVMYRTAAGDKAEGRGGFPRPFARRYRIHSSSGRDVVRRHGDQAKHMVGGNVGARAVGQVPNVGPCMDLCSAALCFSP